MGLKPMTHGTGNHCSIQLSYGAVRHLTICKSKEIFGIKTCSAKESRRKEKDKRAPLLAMFFNLIARKRKLIEP